jgi:hypothetical protein
VHPFHDGDRAPVATYFAAPPSHDSGWEGGLTPLLTPKPTNSTLKSHHNSGREGGLTPLRWLVSVYSIFSQEPG